MRARIASSKLRLEAIAALVRASDFKSGGMCRETHPAGSIPVRFRHRRQLEPRPDFAFRTAALRACVEPTPEAFGTFEPMRGDVLSEFEAHPFPSIDLRDFTDEEGKLMVQGPPVVVHFREIPNSERVRRSIEARCENLASEFQEVKRFEITFEPLGAEIAAAGHATGKNTNVATQATGKNLRAAADQVIEKIERQLRKNHDKRIFAQRREAQRNPAKRSATE